MRWSEPPPPRISRNVAEKWIQFLRSDSQQGHGGNDVLLLCCLMPPPQLSPTFISLHQFEAQGAAAIPPDVSASVSWTSCTFFLLMAANTEGPPPHPPLDQEREPAHSVRRRRDSTPRFLTEAREPPPRPTAFIPGDKVHGVERYPD